MHLKISPDLALPLDAVTQKFAFLGRTGSGKTYAASKLAEEMLAAKAQIIVLDLVGVWYGIRLAADGKGPGFPIPVFGGLHGDVPLEPTGGQLMADLIVDRGLSVVLDISQFEHDSDKARFGMDWAGRFYFRKKAAPSAVHVFIEECQELVPQNPQKGEERMLHAFQRMEKLGRNFGIGVSLISQRPQEVNKKALNQTECLFAFQMTGPHERKAIESWIEEKGLDMDIVGLLPKLAVGQAHVWSPQWLKVSKTIYIGRKQTFNASSTPEVGSAAVARELAPIDLDRIRKEMAATIERSKADDPRELRRQIADLKRTAATAQKATSPPASQDAIEAARSQAYLKARAEAAEATQSLLLNLDHRLVALRHLAEALADHMEGTREYLKTIPAASPPAASRPPTPIRACNPQSVPMPHRDTPHSALRTPHSAAPHSELTGPEQRILDAIAWMESIGVNQPEQTAVAFLAGYTFGGGAFNNPRGALRTKGLIEYLGSNFVRLTPDGRARAASPETPLTTAALHEAIMDRLPGPESKILRVILEHYPDSISNDDCAQQAGYAPDGGAYNNPRGRLRSLDLIEYMGGGLIRARDILFLE
jgi:hypothetical protein